ncbi:tetratricopeptide repeat protein [Dactylosporangium sp. McL0621]|uniref:tetratricopeptide repeat protein n=1 Tax=Dactylosporangium sp. McL0621 TaxID=3415678 RepID=UPI003CF4E742
MVQQLNVNGPRAQPPFAGVWRRLRGSSPVGLTSHLIDGRLPLVRELDPLQLGVKPAIGTYRRDGRRRALPPYLPRDCDRLLDDALSGGGLTIVRGRAASGKTRTAYELLRRRCPDHRLVVPLNGPALRELAASRLGKDVVIWLDDLEHYLGGDGLAAALMHLRQIPIIATMRDEELSRAEGGGVLPLHREISVAPVLSDQEVADLRVDLLADERIAQALRARVGFGEFLAAGHVLLRRWRDGGGLLFHVGQALISAAVDCRRAGYDKPVPAEVLDRLHRHYLPPALRHRSDLPPADEGLRWAARLQLGASSCLEPRDGNTYVAPDYLLDAAQRGDGPVEDRPVSAVWRGVLDLVPPFDAVVIAFHAISYGDLDAADAALQVGIEAGDVDAIAGRGITAVLRGEEQSAESWFVRAAEMGNSGAMANLAVRATQRGDREAAERWHREAALAGRTESMIELALLLADRGADAEARDWLDRCAGDSDPNAAHDIGVRLGEHGYSGWAQEWLQRALDGADNVETVYCLGLVSSRTGDVDAAIDWFHRAAERGYVKATYNLAVLLAQRGDVGAAEERYRVAAAAGLPEAMYGLGYLMHGRGDDEQAEMWRRRAAKAGHGDASHQIGVECRDRGDEAEAVRWWRQAARYGSADAMWELGCLHGNRNDTEGAMVWWIQAAKAGHAQAAASVGAQLWLGGDTGSGERWLTRAADRGSAHAAFILAALRHADDPEAALPWYRRAAELGHQDAGVRLGGLLLSLGAVEDATPWLKVAAEQGDALSMTNYGLLWWQGGDLAQAELWLRRSAEQGEVDAMTRLGMVLNQQSRGEESEAWWRQAANMGDPLGRYLLSCLERQTGRPEAGEPLLRQAAEAGLYFAMTDLSALLRQRGETAEADMWTRRAAEAEPAEIGTP